MFPVGVDAVAVSVQAARRPGKNGNLRLHAPIVTQRQPRGRRGFSGWGRALFHGMIAAIVCIRIVCP